MFTRPWQGDDAIVTLTAVGPFGNPSEPEGERP